MIGYLSADSILEVTSAAVAVLAAITVAGTVDILTAASLGVSIIIGAGDAVRVTVISCRH
jgi:hypothetical protein